MNQDTTHRFNTCKFKKAKLAIKDRFDEYKGIIVVILILWGGVTGCIWLFGDKETRTDTAYTYCNPVYNWNFTHSNFDYPTITCVNTTRYDTAWIHSRYTIPESIEVEYNFVKGIVDWVLSHPVI